MADLDGLLRQAVFLWRGNRRGRDLVGSLNSSRCLRFESSANVGDALRTINTIKSRPSHCGFGLSRLIFSDFAAARATTQ
jgi:hypothetical protein